MGEEIGGRGEWDAGPVARRAPAFSVRYLGRVHDGQGVEESRLVGQLIRRRSDSAGVLRLGWTSIADKRVPADSITMAGKKLDRDQRNYQAIAGL